MTTAQRKILLVDDSKSYQSIFSAAFAESDYRLCICNSGKEALELISREYIDFVCSSFYLKDMEGVALCQSLRTLTKNAYKPFVLLTSVESQDLLKQALPAGVTDIFHKRDVEQLLAFIKRFPFLGAKVAGRILYIEDTGSQRQLVKAMLEAHGLTVDAFASADQAWPQFLSGEYDLVLTDIVLDGMMSGLNLVNQIRRQLGDKGDIPILAVTAFDDRTRRVQLFNLGVTEYIIKPVIEEELFVRINNLLLKQQALKMMAHYDVLTRLPNRTLFADRFRRAIAESNRKQTLLAVCYLDLDGFKQVNDHLGRDAGDQLLVEVAARIKATLRELDTVSRQGGDEFALLLCDLHSLQQCEEILQRLLINIAQPYLIGGQTIGIAASCGLTLYPIDNADPDTLLRHADQAMYLAKQNGRNRYRVFDTNQDQALRTQRLQLQALQQAFARHEFCLYYQPKIDMQSGEVFGLEALIRWNHPEEGLLLPAAFLSYIEGSEFESVLGAWVVEEALKQVTLWNEAGLKLQVSVNISPKHLQAPSFFKQLAALLGRYPEVTPAQLQIEVLESSVLEDLVAVSEVIQTCRDSLGISIALDDFGTGYSSLTHLRRLPIHTIKIDQSFVRDMIEDPNDYAIVEGVVSLAHAFRLEVIAEGVESSAHVSKLLKLGCVRAQGFGIARPMPASAVQDWVYSYRRSDSAD
jgi:diguanylate cyclase (GGDEF)-like protein